MSLLVIEKASKRYRRGRREYVALRDVSMSIEPGEVVAVLGSGKSGRSTLLRIAAGLERPDEGRVIFEGVEMSASAETIGRRIAFCHSAFGVLEGELMVDHVAAGLLARRVSLRDARRRAELALDRCGAAACAGLEPYELDVVERIRVALARALISSPALIVIDEPTAGVGLLDSDPLLRLLRSIADEGVAVLLATGDAASLPGADRALLIDAGAVRGETQPTRAEVLPFTPRERRASGEPGA